VVFIKNIITAQCHGNARHSLIYLSVIEEFRVFSGKNHTFYYAKND
jgi:hypothetical protein